MASSGFSGSARGRSYAIGSIDGVLGMDGVAFMALGPSLLRRDHGLAGASGDSG